MTRKNKEDKKKLIIDGILSICFLVFLLPFGQHEGKAEESHKLLELEINKKIETVIGMGVANRIEIKGEELLEVVGDESKYQLKWNSNRRSIYLTPKVEVGEVIELSLMLLSGEIQDLRLTVGDVLARTIILSRKEMNNFYDDKEREEITTLLQVMIKDENQENKYWVDNVKKKLLVHRTKEITQVKEYKYGKIIGKVVEIENKGKEELIINENEIRGIFSNIKIISLSQKTLLPKEKARLFIIIKKA